MRFEILGDRECDVSGTWGSVVGVVVLPRHELRYAVLPEWREAAHASDGFAADAVALDLQFTDGSRLSELFVVDQNDVAVDPVAQHLGMVLQPDQWNVIRVGLEAVAGRTVAAVLLRVADVRHGDVSVPSAGWLDGVEISEVDEIPERPVERARTRQGSMSTPMLSRGNCVPVVAVPNGFIRGVPVTNASSSSWPYTWRAENGVDSPSAIEAFATSHLPSPWMGERGAFQVMPILSAADPLVSPSGRAREFSHRTEIGQPHYYRVELDGGIRAEMTATDHTVILRFQFPDGAAEGILLFDQIEGTGEFILPAPAPGHPDAVVTGFTDDGAAERADRQPAPRAYLHAHIDQPVIESHYSPRGDSGAALSRGWVRVKLGQTGVVHVRLATSFIGVRQAARNCVLDGADGSFHEIRERTGELWDEWIGRVDLDGATSEHRAMMATALYRVGLFPARGHENVGTAEHPCPAYASPFHPSQPHGADLTGARIIEGELSVDQGFWDVYRTAWPLYSLLDSGRAARLLDGFVEPFRSSGWSSRWSAPGPIDSMTGTSSDITFAHAAAMGVPLRESGESPAGGLDLWSAYRSALRNATAVARSPIVGRKGLATSIHRGWVDSSVTEGLSWTLDGAINDLAVAVLAEQLSERLSADDERKLELQTASEYFRARAGSHANVFNEQAGFYIGRRQDGVFRSDAESYDPLIWGYDYAETNGWGTAFSAPHDGAGLATLHGGRERLAARLETFISTPERGDDSVRGSYPGVIHEMREARNLRLGQLALSNQPAFHIPFMALFAGRPDLAQDLVRTAVERLFSGGEIGQGWPGDEDNGAMGAWWVFAALGLYPLVPGSPGYVLVSPSVRHARLRLGTGQLLTISAPQVDRDHRFIRSVRVDGEEWPSTFLPHHIVAAGAAITFELATTPQRWGVEVQAHPPSLTEPGERPTVLRDVSLHGERSSSAGSAVSVFDDDMSTPGLLCAQGDVVTVRFEEEVAIDFVTVAVHEPGHYSFRLEGRDSAGVWHELSRWNADFDWERQVRPFRVHSHGFVAWRWVAESAVPLLQLELLVRE